LRGREGLTSARRRGHWDDRDARGERAIDQGVRADQDARRGRSTRSDPIGPNQQNKNTEQNTENRAAALGGSAALGSCLFCMPKPTPTPQTLPKPEPQPGPAKPRRLCRRAWKRRRFIPTLAKIDKKCADGEKISDFLVVIFCASGYNRRNREDRALLRGRFFRNSHLFCINLASISYQMRAPRGAGRRQFARRGSA
jgi:hypothetical protein